MAAGAIKLSIFLIDRMFISTVSFLGHSSRYRAVSKGHQIDTKQSCSTLYPFLKTTLPEVMLGILPVEHMEQPFTELRRGHQAYQCPQTHGCREGDFRRGHGIDTSRAVEICHTGRLGGKERAGEAEFPLGTTDHELHQSGARRPQTQAPHADVRVSSDEGLIRRILIVTTV